MRESVPNVALSTFKRHCVKISRGVRQFTVLLICGGAKIRVGVHKTQINENQLPLWDFFFFFFLPWNIHMPGARYCRWFRSLSCCVFVTSFER